MPTLTPEVLQEIKDRTGQQPGSLQFNVKLPDGVIIPADINPNQAATIEIGGGVLDRGTSEGQAIASRFSADPRFASAEATRKAFGLVPTDAGVTTSVIQANPPQLNTSPVSGPVFLGEGNISAKKPVVPTGNLIVDPVTGNQYILGPQGTYVPYKQPRAKEGEYVPGKGVLKSDGTYQPTINETGGGKFPPPVNLSGGGGAANPADFIKQLATAMGTLGGLDASYFANTKKLVQDYFSQRKPGKDILAEEFERFGVKEKMGLSEQLSEEILKAKDELRAIPNNLKKTLEDVGVSQEQLDRLVAKESEKPREILARLLEGKGALAEDINNAMSFVKLFAESRFEDEAIKLKALEFELNLGEKAFENLREDQKFMLGKAFESKGEILKIQLELAKRRAPESVISAVGQMTDSNQAVEFASSWLGDAKDLKRTTEFRTVGGNLVQYILDAEQNIVDTNILGPSGEGDDEDKPLSVDKLAGWQELFPAISAKIQPGMSLRDVQDVYAQAYTPRDWSDEEIRNAIQESQNTINPKTGQKTTGEEILQSMLLEPSLKNLDRAQQIYDETFNPHVPSLIDRLKSWFGAPAKASAGSSISPFGSSFEGYQPLTPDVFQDSNINFPSSFNF